MTETVVVVVDARIAKVAVGISAGQLGLVDLDLPLVRGNDGHSPEISWVGDQISIDGELGPHLTGPGGAGSGEGSAATSTNLNIGTIKPTGLSEATLWVQTNDSGNVTGLFLCTPDES